MNWFFNRNNIEKNKIKALNYALKAEIFSQKSKFNKAVGLLSKAIKLDSTNESFFFSRAHTYMLDQNYKKALKDINTALKLNPYIYYYYLLRADINNLLDKVNDEINDLNSALKLSSKADLFYEFKMNMFYTRGNKTIGDFYKTRLNKISQIKN